jgi:hypothetical protein
MMQYIIYIYIFHHLSSACMHTYLFTSSCSNVASKTSAETNTITLSVTQNRACLRFQYHSSTRIRIAVYIYRYIYENLRYNSAFCGKGDLQLVVDSINALSPVLFHLILSRQGSARLSRGRRGTRSAAIRCAWSSGKAVGAGMWAREVALRLRYVSRRHVV